MKTESICLLALVFVLFAACGTSKTYRVDIRYVPQTPPRIKVEAATVGLTPFLDRRDRGKDVGMRNRLDGSLDRYTTAPASVSESVGQAVQKLLRANGLNIVPAEWDLSVGSVSQIDTDVVVGGEINRFWSHADSLAGRTVIKSEVELTIYVGKPKEGKVLQQTMEMSSEITDVIFSEERIEEALNELLSVIIEDAFEKLLAWGKTPNTPKGAFWEVSARAIEQRFSAEKTINQYIIKRLRNNCRQI